ncbi:MAG TPA: lysylphosphatidylglycerol synthase domain-containing protein [Solirubrobacteraceae bacterium]
MRSRLAAGCCTKLGSRRRRFFNGRVVCSLLTSAASVAAMIAAGGLLIAGVLPGPHDVLRAGVPFLGGCAVIVAMLALPHVWRRSNTSAREGWVDDLVDGTGAAVRSLTRPTWRVLGSVGYLAFDIGVLWATFAAAGREPPLAALTLGYIIGYRANLLPVPGSIGVLDLGLAGTLIAYGAHASQAAAAVLVYHAIAFWIPSVGGLLAYTLLRRRLTDSSSTMETPAPGAWSVPEPWALGAIPTRAG